MFTAEQSSLDKLPFINFGIRPQYPLFYVVHLPFLIGHLQQSTEN